MARGIAISPERLREISARLSNGADDVRTIVSRLAGHMAPVRSESVGSAQFQFNALWDQLQRDANGLQSVLTGLALLTERAATAYGGTGRSMAGAVDEFRAEMDRLSDLLGPVRQCLPAPALRPDDSADNQAERECDAPVIDEDLAAPWARFLTRTAWREIEAGRN
jgi:WXG100 family type VII secretion target